MIYFRSNRDTFGRCSRLGLGIDSSVAFDSPDLLRCGASRSLCASRDAYTPTFLLDYVRRGGGQRS